MNRNFIRIASANIKTKLLNITENSKELQKYMTFAGENNIDILLFPELTLTGVSAGEMISSKDIVERSYEELNNLLRLSSNYETVFAIGLPILTTIGYQSAMVVFQKNKIKNIITRNKYSLLENNYFDNYFYDTQFYYNDEIYDINPDSNIITINDINVQLLFENELITNYSSIDESSSIVLVAGNQMENIESISNTKYILSSLSKLNDNSIIYAGASNYESSSFGIYAANKYIFESGQLLEEGRRFSNGLIYTDINIDAISRNKKYGYHSNESIELIEKEYTLKRKLDTKPYFSYKDNYNEMMRNILDIQSEALARRLRQIPDNKIYLGLSGGLDSTLALIVASLAYYKLDFDSKNIYTVTMPGLGTSSRTKNNAINLATAYNTSLMTIDITDSVIQHFKDIEHDQNQYDITFENSQARERTQVLMDLANKHGGIVLGTGNMSEIALGWSTYNGDHMSMYSVNAGLPKTLLRDVVKYVADSSSNELLSETLYDILDTPVSPELLPTSENDEIVQKTEDSVGPYELHDFFIYHLIRNRSKIENIKFMAKNAFDGKYSDQEIDKWMDKLLWRFTTQQFKRNVSPDFPQILDYSLNSKTGFIMPSDVDPNAFIERN